jgi:phosphoadenosine phosphosulfate reductase
MTTVTTNLARNFKGTHTEGRSSEELRELVSHVGAELELAPAEDIVEWAVATFGDRFCITSSMGDAVLAHVASRVAPGVDIVFLDTGYHFAETIGTADAVGATMDVTLIPITPVQTVAEQDAAYGPELYKRDPDLCCKLRKVQPLEQGLTGYQAWATGLRRDESPTRANTPVVGWDEKRQKVKISPIARWTQDDVDAYVAEHGVLTNPLLMDGYASVGCAPCTRRVLEGEDARAGRWAGRAKTECGLHG